MGSGAIHRALGSSYRLIVRAGPILGYCGWDSASFFNERIELVRKEEPAGPTIGGLLLTMLESLAGGG